MSDDRPAKDSEGQSLKRQLEVAALLITIGLALMTALKAFALLPEKVDELAVRQTKAEVKLESIMTEQNVVSSDIRERLARIQEGQEQFRRDIVEIKADLRAIKQ